MSTAHTATRKSASLRSATGHDYDKWFRRLDEWGALDRGYGDIAGWLSGQRMSDWWAQKVIVEYEQLRGVRQPGARRDSTYAGGASKTVRVSVERAFDAFADPDVRRQWLPEPELSQRASRPRRSLRFDVADGSRVVVELVALDHARASVTVEQERLAEASAATQAKADWRRRLGGLKTLLET